MFKVAKSKTSERTLLDGLYTSQIIVDKTCDSYNFFK